jgi:hypothetical protein
MAYGTEGLKYSKEENICVGNTGAGTNCVYISV